MNAQSIYDNSKAILENQIAQYIFIENQFDEALDNEELEIIDDLQQSLRNLEMIMIHEFVNYGLLSKNGTEEERKQVESLKTQAQESETIRRKLISHIKKQRIYREVRKQMA